MTPKPLMIALATAFVSVAWATADGPDHFRVRGNASVPMRKDPSASSSIIFELPGTARGLRNEGCGDEAPDGWCRVSWRGHTGWVSTQRLGEDQATPDCEGKAVHALIGAKLQDLRGTCKRDADCVIVSADVPACASSCGDGIAARNAEKFRSFLAKDAKLKAACAEFAAFGCEAPRLLCEPVAPRCLKSRCTPGA